MQSSKNYASSGSGRTVALYVHGLWMTGVEGVLLRRRLARRLHAVTPMFSYSSVRLGIAGNARRLAEHLQQVRADTLHLVGHSLGGLVIYEALRLVDEAMLPPGRVVLLGSPVGGSRAAQSLSRWRAGRLILGRTIRETLIDASARRWDHPSRALGVIAGTLDVGLGRLVNRHVAPSDGTVYVDETELPGATESLVIAVSHTGLPLSPAVASLTAQFLDTGRFSR